MATYKIPQDVEADDKLLGPFSFRQFIYLMIVFLAIGLAWGLAQLFIPLAILPLPIILFFGAIALPLRKDQPMEIYMAAIVSFYLKPRRRLWDPDGIDSLIEITAPKIVEYRRTKDITTSEAERRFSYLAQIVDSQGWAVRGTGVQAPNSPMNSEVYFEAQNANDVLDNDNQRAMSLNDKLAESDARRRQQAIDNMKNAFENKPQTDQFQMMPTPSSYFGGTTLGAPVASYDPAIDGTPKYNPYPEIQQSVIQPMGQKKAVPAEPPETTSEKEVPADIINLANNADLSIATIAREANRIQEKYDLNQEVLIQLR